MSRVAYATINAAALKHNLAVAKKAAPHSKILAVIKAHGYGHGLLRVAAALDDADAFAVTYCEEALTLRENGVNKRIVALHGFADAEQLSIFKAQQIEPIIHNLEQLELLENTHFDSAFSIWLKVDTGMHRLGISPEQFAIFWQRLNAIPALKNNIHIMTHFANADDVNDGLTAKQIALFFETIGDLKAPLSMANSGGLLHWFDSQVDWVRPGLLLYGASPLQNKTAEELNLKPVMTLKSRVIAIKAIKKGECVGYGSTWCANENTNIAVVSIGYGDGYPRHITEDTPVLINNTNYSIVGRVSMDMLCVNLGSEHNIKTDEEVILWGDGLPVEIIAEKAGTIPYELFCQITSRVRLENINE